MQRRNEYTKLKNNDDNDEQSLLVLPDSTTEESYFRQQLNAHLMHLTDGLFTTTSPQYHKELVCFLLSSKQQIKNIAHSIQLYNLDFMEAADTITSAINDIKPSGVILFSLLFAISLCHQITLEYDLIMLKKQLDTTLPNDQTDTLHEIQFLLEGLLDANKKESIVALSEPHLDLLLIKINTREPIAQKAIQDALKYIHFYQLIKPFLTSLKICLADIQVLINQHWEKTNFFTRRFTNKWLRDLHQLLETFNSSTTDSKAASLYYEVCVMIPAFDIQNPSPLLNKIHGSINNLTLDNTLTQQVAAKP